MRRPLDLFCRTVVAPLLGRPAPLPLAEALPARRHVCPHPKGDPLAERWDAAHGLPARPRRRRADDAQHLPPDDTEGGTPD